MLPQLITDVPTTAATSGGRMVYRWSLGSLLACGMLIGSIASQPLLADQPQESPPSDPAPSPSRPESGMTKLHEIEGISEHRLSNGLKVLLFPDESKDVVTVNMTVFVGSRHEGYGEAGMAHLLEHMLFKGTPDHPNIPQVLNDRGARFNGTTWVDRTNYYETLPATNENLEFALRLEADRLVNSHIKGEDLASEMTVVRNEFERGENSPVGVLMQRMQATAYEWHNYGKSTIGNRSDIERVPIVALRQFYRKYYRPDNVMLIVAGKFDPEQALQYIEKYFGGLPQPNVPLDPTYTVEPPQDGERTVVLRRVGDVQYAGAAYHVPASSHPDFAAVRALTYILSDEPSGRLYKSMVEQELASNVFAMSSAFHDPGILMVFAEVPKAASLETARSALIATLEEGFAIQPVTEEETERAKQQLLKRRELEANESNQIAVSLSDWAAQGDWRLYFLFRDEVETLTADKIQAVALKYLVRNNRTVGLFIPTDQPQRIQVPESPNLAQRVDGYVGRETVAAGEAFDIDPLAIEARTQRGEFHAGYQYALLPKKTRGGSVNLMLTLRFGDEQSLRGNLAAAELVGAMMERGSKSLSYQEVQDTLTRLRADMVFNSTPGLLQIRVKTRAEYVQPVIELIADLLRNPRFDQAELEVLRRQILTSIEGSLSEPNSLAPLNVRRRLAPFPAEDVRYVPTFEEEMTMYREVTIDQIRQFYADFIGGQAGELVVVGDFDADAVKQQVQGIVGDWRAPKPYVRFDRPAVTDAVAGVQRIATPDKSNAMLYGSMQFTLDDQDPRYAALEIGNHILGGGALSSRLADRVRQQEGLSYGVGTGISGRHRDVRTDFTLYAITNPENVDRLLKVIEEEVQRLRSDGVTDDELARAKEAFLQGERVRRAEDSSLANLLLSSLFNGRTLQFHADYEARVSGLDKATVDQAIVEFVDLDKLVTGVAGDFKQPADE